MQGRLLTQLTRLTARDQAVLEGLTRLAAPSPGRPTAVAVAADPVPFPPNTAAGPHDFFPLTGQHATLACTERHAQGQYKATPKQCTGCHPADLPAQHVAGTCDMCHTTTGWTPAQFSHTGQVDCASCHTKCKPAEHYAGQCSAGHTTNTQALSRP